MILILGEASAGAESKDALADSPDLGDGLGIHSIRPHGDGLFSAMVH